ncbi:microtubule-associated protein futsch isoform X2 [Zophobas morio]|uniref:microtubule-associated protein futsch isoform X2 n=1 Tax=Zophobas morio TaxID=2755281 RepID=UPI00308325AE
MEAVNGVSEGDKGGPPPPSPLTGCYLLIVIGEPHCNEHKDIILQRVAKGLLSWDVNDCLVDLEKELAIITEQALEGEEARYGERLIQFASENLVTEILIHPVVSTLAQCVRNLLSSFTRHRHIIHAGYTFANNGSWVLQDGTFSSTDFWEAFQEIEVLRVIRAYENGISLDLHCAPEGDWTRLPKEPFAKGCKVRVNPNDVLTAGSPSISSFINYLEPFLVSAELDSILESSDVVGNIRFSRPTLYVFPGGQGDAALFGINGFNMLLDGGFSRKACFWDFVRHLDRLDAVLLTRLNNSNVNGISAVLRRKRQNALYPQIGHFFCNIQERKAILSPDGDKDKDPLLINLLEEGQDIVSNLRHLSLIPQVCYRDSEPINLYHKVGHGTLDMYVLSPAKDSKEVREFLQKWNNNDQKLFANLRTNKEFVFPLQNLVSICALLVWQPANPEDTITRILFPGSSPQNKIFEGLDKIKSLEFIKHPVCSEKSLAPTTIIKAKQSVIERIIQPEKKIPLDNKKEKIHKPPEVIDTEMKNGEINGVQPTEKGVPVKKSDSTESEKSISKPKKIIENGEKIDKSKPKPRSEFRSKPRSESQQRKVKTAEKKPSPTTPKKQVDKIDEPHKPKPKPSPTSTPAKSAKDANNRKVVESKIKAAPLKKEPPKPISDKKEVKVERKPISRRPKDISKLAGSPSKKVNGVQKPDSISRRGKLDKEGTTDSSTVSTPSAEQDSILKKDISKLTSDEIQNMKAQELADLKEEQEAVKEIEAVFRKGELQEDKPSDFRKVKDVSIDDKLESEEYLIIEKTEIQQDLVNEPNKEEETQKIARDSEESEKQRKLSEEKETAVEEKRMEIQDEVQKIITSATDIVKAKEEVVEASKEVSVTSPEDKIDNSTDKKDIEEIKEIAQESQPDEKGSANIESGATTTAPTLPEDERMPLDEIKEDNGDQIIEEKHVKEDTKEKDVPVIQLPPKTFENITKLPPVVGIRLDKQSHIRDIVKTPDEVADLPVHEEVEFDHYDEYPSATETKSELEEVKKEEVEKGDTKEKLAYEKEDKKINEKQDLGDVQKDKMEKETVIEKDVVGDTKKTDVVVKEEQTRTEIKQEAKISEEKAIQKEAVEPEVKTVIPEDLNKKELSKSPDEEKDTDEHELEHKKEEIAEIKSSSPIKLVEEEKEVVKTEVEPVKEETVPKIEKESVEESKPIAKEQEVVEEEKEPIKEQKELIKEVKDSTVKDEKVDIPEKITVKPEEVVKLEPKDDSKVSEIKEHEIPAEKGAKPPEVKDGEKLIHEEVPKTDEFKKDVKVEEVDKQKESPTQDQSKTEEVIEKSETEVKEKDDIKEKEAKDIIPEEKDKIDDLKQLPEVPKDEIIVTDGSKISEPADELKLKEDVSAIHEIEEKLQKLKEEMPEVKEITESAVSEPSTTEVKKYEEAAEPKKEETQLKEDITTIEKIDEKLQKLKDEAREEQVKAVSEVVTHKTEEPQHAEPVVITTDSLPESPGVEEKRIEEKIELGRKSPKEREEDVAKIVASVAEVLKSDAPLEEFEGKIPFNIPYKSYTTELRETHITTVESPVTDEARTIKAIEEIVCPKASSTYFIEEERKIAPIHEEQEIQESKISKMIKDSNELMQATSRMIQDIKHSQPKDDKIDEEPTKEEQEGDGGTVHRMLVTASSEDGGEETEICPAGTITFSRSSESSGRSSPELQSQKLSQKSSIADTFSEATVITKSLTKDTQSSLEETKVIEDSADVKESPFATDDAVSDKEKVVEEIVDKSVVDKLAESKDTVTISDKEKKDDVNKQVEDTKELEEIIKKDLVEDIEKQEIKKDVTELDKVSEATKTAASGKAESEQSKSPEIIKEELDTKTETALSEEKVDESIESTVVSDKLKDELPEKKKGDDDSKKDDTERVKSPEKSEKIVESKDISPDLSEKAVETVDKKVDIVVSSKQLDGPQELTSVTEKIKEEPLKESIAPKEEFDDKKLETTATLASIKEVEQATKDDLEKAITADKEDKETKEVVDKVAADKPQTVDTVKETAKIITTKPEEMEITKEESKEIEAKPGDAVVQPTEESKEIEPKPEDTVVQPTEESKEIEPKPEDAVVQPTEEIREGSIKTEDTLLQKDDVLTEHKKPEGAQFVEDLVEKKTVGDIKEEIKDVKKTSDEKKETEIAGVKSLEDTESKKEHVEDLTKTLTKEADTALETVKETIKKVEVDVDKKVGAVAKEIEEKRSFLGGLVNDIGESLLHDTCKLIESAQKQVEEIKDSTKYKIEELKEDITTKKEAVVNAVEEFKDTALKETSTTTSEMTDAIKGVVETSETKLSELKEIVKEDTEKLLKSTDQVMDSVKSKSDEIKEVVMKEKEASLETSKEVKESVTKKKENLLETVKDFEETLVNDATATTEEVKEEVSTAKKVLDEQIKDIKETLATQKETAAGVITDIQDSVSKDIETKIDDLKKEVTESKEKSKIEIEEVCQLIAEKVDEKVADLKKSMDEKSGDTKEAVDGSKKVLEEIKDKITDTASTEIKEIEKKAEAVLEEVKTKEDIIVKDTVEDVKQAEDKFEEKKEKLAQKLEHLSDDLTKAEISLNDSVESTVTEISSLKKEVAEAVKESDSDVSEPDREGVLSKPECDEKDEKKIVSGVAHKVESDVESIVTKSVAEVKEFVEETKDAITAIFKGDGSQVEVLEKSTLDTEEKYKTVSDMAKSAVVEKCDKPSEEDHKRQEKQLEESAQTLEKEYERVTDMTKSIAFEKCEKPLSEEQKEEKTLEKSAKDIEENYKVVSDMAKSTVFEKCEKPLTEVQKEEAVLEKQVKDVEENYKTVSDMAQSVIFDECEIPKVEDQIEKHLKSDMQEEKKVSDSGKADSKLPSADAVEIKSEDATSEIKFEQSKADDKKDSPKMSGKSSPEKLETKEVQEELACKLSGKSSPALSSEVKDVTKEGSGKSTPDLKDVDHIKVDNQDSLLSGKSSPGLSGKSSPILSGRSSPGTKAESKDSLLSDKSSPEHTKPDSKESSLSEKSSPPLPSEVKPDEKDKVLTTEVKETLSAKSSPAASGKTSPALSGEVKAESGKLSPELKADKDSKIMEVETKEDDLTKGKVSPVPPTDKDTHDKKSGQISPQQDIISTLDKEKIVEDEKGKEEIKTEKLTIEHTDSEKVSPKEELKEISQKSKDVSAEVSIPEKKTETEKSKTQSEDSKTVTTEVEETKEKMVPISDVQVAVKVSEEKKVVEKSTSDLSKLETPEDTKHSDEKVETKDVDSIDSGIGTEVEAKLKKSEDVDTPASSVQPVTLKDQDSSAKPVGTKEESIAGPSASLHDTSLSPAKTSTEDLHLSGKSTPDIAEVEKMKEIQEKRDKHIPGSSTPPTVPVSPIVKELSSTQPEETKTSSPTPIKSSTVTSLKDSDIRSCTPGSDDYEIGASTHSDISSGQVSRAPHLLESERIESDEDDDVPGSPMSVTSQVAHSRSSSRYDFEDERIGTKMDPMNTSFYGALPDEDETELDFEKAMAEHRQTRGEDLVTSAEDSPSYLYELTKAKYSTRIPEPEAASGQSQLDQINKNGSSNVMTASFIGDLPTSTTASEAKKDVLDSWGKPLGLPSPAPPNDNRGTPKKERKLPSNVTAKNKLNDDKKRSESPSKYKNKKLNPVYVDLTYVPHHGNSYYSYVDFFKRVRARYYVFSGIEPSREVYNALLEAKQTWEDKELEVTIIPTYDTDILGYWVAENEELLTKYKIDLSPSASRCTINLQDHETSCSAYRLEF